MTSIKMCNFRPGQLDLRVSIGSSVEHSRLTSPGFSHLDAIHQREQAHIAACDQGATEETGVKDLEVTSPWMKRTDWARVYDGTRRDLLVRISEVRKSWSYNQDFPIGQHEGTNLVSKKSDELKIWLLMEALDRALDRCEETMRRTGHPILCWLNSGSRNRFYQKPFGFLGRAATRQRYRRLFQRIIPFIFRAYNMTPAVRHRLPFPAHLTPTAFHVLAPTPGRKQKCEA
ncbi:hypothetical protein V501_02725 [Pseudogymnoascus sp. VKM F-4519 (FW-2642)]|nr:hypothetical protein V501_02725 [Pseudogymnoascus sp. VKM F-4519 (FW-2642)]